MSRTHKLRVIETLSAAGIALADFTASVTVSLHPAYGDGFNEPREPAHAELEKVEQIEGPFIAQRDLNEWASEWVNSSQDTIFRDVADREPF